MQEEIYIPNSVADPVFHDPRIRDLEFLLPHPGTDTALSDPKILKMFVHFYTITYCNTSTGIYNLKTSFNFNEAKILLCLLFYL
jgi:hypothetical protein